MKPNLLIFFAAVVLVICSAISVFVLSLLIWAILGIGFLASLMLTLVFSGISIYAIYRKILSELEEMEIDLKFEEDEDEF
jgi:membrane protein implicated in regulation of membrane protease activity